jgi:hypothetical protein
MFNEIESLSTLKVLTFKENIFDIDSDIPIDKPN